MEFFRDLLPLVQKYMQEKERIDRVIDNVKKHLLPDLRELVRVFAPGVMGVLEAPRRERAGKRLIRAAHEARAIARRRKRKR